MNNEIFEQAKQRGIEEFLKKNFPTLNSSEKIAMHKLLEQIIDVIMKSEREIFLENNSENKGNGYYPRTLTTGSFKLNLQVPRDRKGQFRPHIIPEPYKRNDTSYTDLSRIKYGTSL